jgi:hypothetical protein
LSKGTHEQLLVPVQQALGAIRQKGLLTAYEKAGKDKEEWTNKLTKATKDLTNYKGKDENSPEHKRVKEATEAIAHKDEVIESIMAQVFQLYSNLLTEEARRRRSKILKEQIDVSPWNDLYGVKHTKKGKRSWSAFMDCVTFHLLSVFGSDTGETQRFYISNWLKTPNRVPIRQFMQKLHHLRKERSQLEFL